MANPPLAALAAQIPLPAQPAIFAGVRIAAAGPIARFSVRTKTPLDQLPRINAAVELANGYALCLGPDEWLIMLPEGSRPAEFAGVHSLTDVSHRALGLEITGVHAATLLQSGCPLDLSLRAFSVGKASRTLYDGVEIIVWRTGETAFHIEVWRSFAPYVYAALMLAAGHL